jgi:hypothetical protein
MLEPASLLQLPRRVVGALRRNPEPLRALATIAIGTSRDDRVAALHDLLGWIQRKQLDDEHADGLLSAKGFALRLIEDRGLFADDLDSTPHLGCLASVSPVPATRLDYVALNLRTLLELKKRFPTLGLGSTNLHVEHDGHKLTGLEIAQSLVILLNAGHLFGTFATERGLLFMLDSDPAVEQDLLAAVPEKLRPWAGKILRDRNLYRFFYVLAAVRISDLDCNAMTKLTLIDVLACFDPEGTHGPGEKLVWAFRRSRQLAYQRMHSLMQLGLSFEQDGYSEVLGGLRDSDLFAYDEDNPPPLIQDVLDALDRLHAETIFTSPDAAALVLGHLREFRSWWEDQQARDIPPIDRVRSLWSRPDDWPSNPTQELQHYCRLKFPAGTMSWPTEVRSWRGNGPFWDGSATFLLTPAPRPDGNMLFDIYSVGGIKVRARYDIASELATRNRATWDSASHGDSRIVWRSIATFAARMLQEVISARTRVHLEPMKATGEHVGYAMACVGVEPGCSKLLEIANCLVEENRREELKALVQLRRDCEPEGPFTWITFIGKLWLIDADSGKALAEIDGLWVDLTPKSVVWTVIEHKGGRGRGRVAQLEKAAELITLEAGKLDLINLSQGSVAVREFRELASPSDAA